MHTPASVIPLHTAPSLRGGTVQTFTPSHPTGGYDEILTTPHGRFYYRHGRLHREDGPAREWADGDTREWFRAGLRHRDDGPALETRIIDSWWADGRIIDWHDAA